MGIKETGSRKLPLPRFYKPGQGQCFIIWGAILSQVYLELGKGSGGDRSEKDQNTTKRRGDIREWISPELNRYQYHSSINQSIIHTPCN